MNPVSAVISTWNKKEDLRENLLSIRKQTCKPDEIVVVDNCSTDGTVEMIREEFPEVRLIVMPHAGYGACETFNIGFKSARHGYIAILDDDVVLPPDWLEKMMKKYQGEPEETALISSNVVEPGMPEEYRMSPAFKAERYMSTFRGCASLARKEVLERAGFYDEKFFIYGNERDLTARILNLGFRVKLYPGVEIFHKTPFGMKMGKRSLYFHTRNLWWTLFKYHTVVDILRFIFIQAKRLLLPGKKKIPIDSVGSIGFAQNVRGTPWGILIVLKATIAAFLGIGHCLKRREVCRSPDFSLPIQ